MTFLPIGLRPFGAAICIAAALLLSAPLAAPARADDAAAAPAHESPLDLVNALHAAYGEHHARAAHAKGIVLEGSFAPAAEARALTKATIFTGGSLPVTARFSLGAGIPDLPDTDGAAPPTGFALKIKAADGEYDLVMLQHNGFVAATGDEFAQFLRAAGASGPDVPHPTPIEQFLGSHPAAKAFVTSLTMPASYATATFFGNNSFKLTSADGTATFVRYRLVPRAGEHYLTPDELKAQAPSYLEDEIVQRVATEPVVFDWVAQVAEAGDKIEDPSIPWPEGRKLVPLGSFTLAKQPADPQAADKRALFLPGTPHAGIDPADPMLALRNQAYAISFGQRQ